MTSQRLAATFGCFRRSGDQDRRLWQVINLPALQGCW